MEKPSKYICTALLAHVDAGKTTLSEAILYATGSIRRMGRVDNQDAFLDHYELERARGITIFSKQAEFSLGDTQVTLLDTPGHVDFSSEMERTLRVLDYAVLVVSGADGVQGHTRTLWRLLKKYEIPVFLFVNKMDQTGCDREKLMEELRKRLDENCVDFSAAEEEDFYEAAAMCSEEALEEFLETNRVGTERLRELIAERRLFPCFFGSALRNQGVAEFLEGFAKYGRRPSYPEEFGARVYKITRDDQGNRLTHMKITGGVLEARALVRGGGEEAWEEKVNQIRVYSGGRYEAPARVSAGQVCAVTGLSATFPGEGLGWEAKAGKPLLEPVLTYRVLLPENQDPVQMLPKLRQLEEEDPQLHIVWDEQLKEIQVQLMGEIQLQVLKSVVQQRFGVSVEFGAGNIVYKETIANSVEGVGHFEPLRHYAEVHLLLEPGQPGSGIELRTSCSEDMLARNWQRLVLTHLGEREHRGVLTGAAVTDLRITLTAGRAHLKHTEGGDFRQATYRALRQGLMEAESVLLEPYYEFVLEVPEQMTGRAMTDLEQRSAVSQPPRMEEGMTILEGTAPVSAMQNYAREVSAYTKGYGRLSLVPRGYAPCHNTEEILAEKNYDPDRDAENPTGSVFCAHGAGFVVPWDQVKEYMHVESPTDSAPLARREDYPAPAVPGAAKAWVDTEEIDEILERTFYANRKTGFLPHKGIRPKSRREEAPVPAVTRTFRKPEKKREYLLVDGYNIIYAWEDLRELAEANIDGARGRLLDILCNYQAVRRCELIAVFDAYRVKGHRTEILDYHNIHVVYTKEAETADRYIEKFAHENARRYQVTVATSDGLEQIIILGQGCTLLSARELQNEIAMANQQISEVCQGENREKKRYLLDSMDEQTARWVEELKSEASSGEKS